MDNYQNYTDMGMYGNEPAWLFADRLGPQEQDENAAVEEFLEEQNKQND